MELMTMEALLVAVLKRFEFVDIYIKSCWIREWHDKFFIPSAFIQQIFTKHLRCARHFAKYWG